MREEHRSNWSSGLDALGLRSWMARVRPRVLAANADRSLRLVIRPGADEMRLGYRLPDRTRGEIPLATVEGRWAEWLAALQDLPAAPPPTPEPAVSIQE